MKKDELQFIICRYDHYYDAINNKGQFFLGLNTFLIGSIGVGFFSIKNLSEVPFNLLFLAVFLAATGIISIYFIFRALLPYWGTKHKKSSSSLIFFEIVRKLTKEQYISKINAATPKEFEEDLAIQAHELAIGLSKKFHRLKLAGWFLLVQFILIIPFTYLIYQHLKQ